MRKFDIVLANPPYSIKTWDREAFINDKWGRNFLGTPPQSKADYAFIQHILSSMNDHGRCAILLPHGVLNRLIEKDIRQKLIQNDLIDAVISIGKNLFFNSKGIWHIFNLFHNFSEDIGTAPRGMAVLDQASLI